MKFLSKFFLNCFCRGPITLLAVILLQCLLIESNARAETQIWSQTISAGSPTSNGLGRHVLKMSNGDYVATIKVIPGTSANVRVIRTNSSGTILWTTDLDKGRSDDVNDLVVDNSGNVYVSMRPGIVGQGGPHNPWTH